jgi:hypothetical protein
MVLSVQLLLLLIPFVIFLVLAIINSEPRNSDFWWKLLIAGAVVISFGVVHS